jgi:hypothetical protein
MWRRPRRFARRPDRFVPDYFRRQIAAMAYLFRRSSPKLT